MSNITKHAMLAAPAISVWTARRYDRAVSDKVAQEHKADAKKSGRYNKCLINPDAPSFLAVTQVAGEARRWHQTHTLPWSQDGARILSAEMYMDYAAKMSEFRLQFDHAVAKFLEDYPALKAQARTDLNGLYKEDDYPTVRELKEKFRFRISILPVPSAGDFRVELGDDSEEIREAIEAEVKQAVVDAQQERWNRLLTVVSNAVERLSSPDAIFRDSLIENIQKEVKVLPKLALEKDANFDEILDDVKKKLTSLEPSRLREDRDARADAARKAAEIARKMSAFMGR